ncbi:MAG: hypothetical protein OEZ39_00975 [Gammaproteobacteria bacterium]|nr:hypothetical protein [Gammaproteobacteria bacterium]MDH5650423.1 hypothetical protein [Gammaproteobacteria bacterium]
MSDLVRITWDDLQLGKALPWNIYDQNNKLLLSAGHIITSKETMDNLRQYVLYRNELDHQHGRRNKQKKCNPFTEAEKLLTRIGHLFGEIEAGNPTAGELAGRLAADLLHQCRIEPEACLAVLRVPNSWPYSLYYTLQRAIISAMLVIREDVYMEEEIEIVSAALTFNVGMYTIQDEIRRQMRFPSDEQQYVIDHYPLKSATLLKAAGITNTHWLEIVQQHKAVEKGDIDAGETCDGTVLLATADHYCEVMNGSAYWQPASLADAIDKFFGFSPLAGHHFVKLLFEVLTVYPPGSFVKLTNGETAIVVQRGKQDPMQPVLKSITGPTGNRYANPLLRDCHVNDYVIDGFTEFEQQEVLNYSRLWGYVK